MTALLVVVPYVDGMLSENTRRVVAGSGLPRAFIRVTPGDDGFYGRLVRRLWSWQCDTIICEHDVEPTCGQLAELVDCGHDWCGFNYDDGLYPDGPMFGLVRLSRRLMVRHPHAAEVALVTGKRKDTDVPWWQVDAMMARDLMIRGETWRPHQTQVHHVHVGAPSGPA